MKAVANSSRDSNKLELWRELTDNQGQQNVVKPAHVTMTLSGERSGSSGFFFFFFLKKQPRKQYQQKVLRMKWKKKNAQVQKLATERGS